MSAEDDFAVVAREVLARAGLSVPPDELPLIQLIRDGLVQQLRLLESADLARFPFEPIDPRRAPD